MAGPIKGIDIAISADTSGVTKGLKEVTSESMKTSKNLKTVESLLNLDPHNTELVAQKQKILAQNIEQTKDKLAKLKAAQDDVRAAFERGEISEEQYISFQGEIVKTESRLKHLEGQTQETGEAMEEAGEQSSGFGDKLKNGLATAAKAAGAALVGVGAAAGKLAKEVIAQAGELEQNLGGAESVFGEYAEHIAKAGEDAYKNLGLSQSEYLATANKMGALLQGSGFTAEQSAQMTEKAMQRAADMASVMGIDMSQAMESVAGAAKGNFSMMDNLGVAINDTAIKAYALEHGLGEVETTQDKVNVAMQMFLDKTEQYDGNFAREATETISGSFGLMEASWNSLIAGLGSGEADIENLANNVADAFGAVVDNVVPVINRIVEALPKVADALLSALPMLLPTLTTAFTQLVDMIIAMLPQLIPVASEAITTITTALINNLPQLVSSAFLIIASLAQGLIDALPEIVSTGLQVISQLALGIAQALPTLIPTIVDVALQIVDTLLDNIDLLIDAAIQLMIGLAQGLITAIPRIVEKVPTIIQKLLTAILNNLPKLLNAGVQLIKMLAQGLVNTLGTIGSAAGKIVTTIWNAIKELPKKALGWGKDIIQGLVNGIKEKIGAIKNAVSGVADKIKSYLHFSVPDEGPLTDYETWMPDFMTGLAKGIRGSMGIVKNAVSDLSQAMVPDMSGALAQYDRSSLELAQNRQKAVPAYPSAHGGNSFNITVNVQQLNSDYDARMAAEIMAQELARLTADNNSRMGAWSV